MRWARTGVRVTRASGRRASGARQSAQPIAAVGCYSNFLVLSSYYFAEDMDR